MAGPARRWSGATRPLSPHTPISEHHGEQESHSMRPRGPLVTNEPSRDHTLDHRRGFIVLAPLAVAALLFLPGIGQRILYSGDEARYALLARNMVETGDWLVPRIGNDVHMEKSPLFIWSIAAFSLARRDVTELTAVLPAALSGIAGVAATLLLGRRMFNAGTGLLGDYLAPRFQPWDRFSELFFVVGPIGVGFLPWTLFLPSAVRHGWWSAEDEDVRRRFRFLLIWVVVYAVVITILPHKRERYLLPTYPVLAIMIGWLWDQWARRPAPSSLRKHGWAWAVLAIAMSLVVLLPPPVRLEQAVLIPATFGGKLVLVGLLLATAVITIVTARMGRPLFTFAAVCAPMALILAYETSIFVPAFNRSFDVKSFSQRLATKLAPEARLVTLGVGALPVEFYSHRSARAVRHPMEVEESLQDGGPVHLVADERWWRVVNDTTGRPWSVWDRTSFAGKAVVVASPGERR